MRPIEEAVCGSERDAHPNTIAMVCVSAFRRYAGHLASCDPVKIRSIASGCELTTKRAECGAVGKTGRPSGKAGSEVALRAVVTALDREPW